MSHTPGPKMRNVTQGGADVYIGDKLIGSVYQALKYGGLVWLYKPYGPKETPCEFGDCKRSHAVRSLVRWHENRGKP